MTVSQNASAQDDDFFIEEPGDFEEPEDFDTPPIPDDENFDGSPPGFIPPPVRGGGMGAIRNSGRVSSNRPPTGGAAGGPAGAVEFYLVDPPKYWKKKPRPQMPKPKGY